MVRVGVSEGVGVKVRVGVGVRVKVGVMEYVGVRVRVGVIVLVGVIVGGVVSNSSISIVSLTIPCFREQADMKQRIGIAIRKTILL